MSKSLYKTFETKKNLEQEGVWVAYADGDDDEKPFRVKLARAGGANDDFNKAFERATKPYRKAIAAGSFDAKLADRLYREVFAEHVVKGWENLTHRDGTPRPYSKEEALALLIELPNLYADLREQATSLALFREEQLEADLGNSGTA